MRRYIVFELISIICFILLIKITRILGNSILTNPLLETVMIALFMIIAFTILIIIPSMMLLSLRDKVAPRPSKLTHRNYRILTGLSLAQLFVLFILNFFIPSQAFNVQVFIMLIILFGVLLMPSVLFFSRDKGKNIRQGPS